MALLVQSYVFIEADIKRLSLTNEVFQLLVEVLHYAIRQERWHGEKYFPIIVIMVRWFCYHGLKLFLFCSLVIIGINVKIYQFITL